MIAGLRGRLMATRLAGLVLAAALGTGLAVTAGSTFASAAPAGRTMSQMAGMSPGGHARTGYTKGWYDHHTVRFFYSKNFYCQGPPASKASSRCEAGADYTQTPSNSFDPLYVIVPLGFTPPKGTLQCPVTGNCIDHPHTIDLSAVLGSGTQNLPLPPHSHIVATANNHKAEWWNVVVVGVKSRSAWDKIVCHKSDWELRHLQRVDSKDVTGNITTNLFLYFSVLR